MTEELKHKAEVTKTQFSALRCQLNKSTVVAELKERKKLNRITKNPHFSAYTALKWLKNSWNTERILRTNLSILSEDENFFALQWSFPQSYYSVYCSAQAFFHSCGRTANSHTSTIKDISELMKQKYYPKSVCLLAKGGMNQIEFEGLKYTSGYASKYFRESETFSIENQICQLLKSSREYLLKQQKDSYASDISKHPTLQNKKGEISGRFTNTQWDYVANKLGDTNIIHFLYRKRIKSNYRDIDTFQYEEIKALDIHKDIIEITSYLNFVHEVFIYKAIGKNRYKQLVDNYDSQNKISWLNQRYQHIENNF